MEPSNYRKVFEPDNRTLLSITVFDVGSQQWQELLDYVSRTFVVVYTENGIPKPLPDVDSIFASQRLRSVMLEVMLQGFTVNCHFSPITEVRMNVLPEDVDSSQKAESVFQLMLAIADTLGRTVFLMPELGSATDDQLRAAALCIAEPNRNSVQCLM